VCGIVGTFVHEGGVERWREHIEHAMHRMTRRGPDASGFWSDGEYCAFGFRRLSILDLSDAGNQPMLARDGRYALVYNGEIYNFREIKQRLESRGVTFRSTGDAEVVLHALVEFGERALDLFNGMFALAFYDAGERRLLLARDHAGIKPLYVLQHREGIVFASQYDQILSHPWARSLSIDAGSLALYLHLGYVPPPHAVLAGTSAIQPGSYLIVDGSGRAESRRYFDFPRCPVPDLAAAAADEAVDAAIGAAVRRQLVSDVPVGVLLSGGIDSPLVAAKMQAAMPTSIPAFTLAAGDRRLDESPDARRYADAIGLEHVVRPLGADDVIGMLPDVVDASGEPHDDYSAFPMAAISRAARERVTVVLSGDGGDDIFWGYPDRMIEPLRTFSNADTDGRRAAAAHMRRQQFVDSRDLAAIFPFMPRLPADLTLFQYDGGGVDALAQWLRWNEFSGHLGRVLQKVDRASMHHSLEVRVPLLDREVIDVAARVDWRSCVDLQRTVGKLPLRRALNRHVGFQTEAKRGFTVPMSSWLRGPLRPLFEDVVLARQDLLGLPVDRAALASLFRRHLLHIANLPWLLWRLLSLALWESRHLQPVPAHAR
jgi:asparagine synthase (glutamine-hydrolysing)